MSVHSSSWKIRNEQKLTSKVLETSSLPQFEKTSLKSEKKYKNHRHAEYHHALKRKKNSVKCQCRVNLGLIIFKASVQAFKKVRTAQDRLSENCQVLYASAMYKTERLALSTEILH